MAAAGSVAAVAVSVVGVLVGVAVLAAGGIDQLSGQEPASKPSRRPRPGHTVIMHGSRGRQSPLPLSRDSCRRASYNPRLRSVAASHQQGLAYGVGLVSGVDRLVNWVTCQRIDRAVQSGTASLPTGRRDRLMATDASNESPDRTPAEPVRKILVRDTFFNRGWTFLAETFAHPRTRSVLRFEPSDQVNSEPSK